MSKVTQNTLIPIGVALAVIGGGAAWLTRIQMVTAANATGISEVKSELTVLRRIEHRLTAIECELKKLRGESCL